MLLPDGVKFRRGACAAVLVCARRARTSSSPPSSMLPVWDEWPTRTWISRVTAAAAVPATENALQASGQ